MEGSSKNFLNKSIGALCLYDRVGEEFPSIARDGCIAATGKGEGEQSKFWEGKDREFTVGYAAEFTTFES